MQGKGKEVHEISLSSLSSSELFIPFQFYVEFHFLHDSSPNRAIIR